MTCVKFDLNLNVKKGLFKIEDAFSFFDYGGLTNKKGEPNSLNGIGNLAYSYRI
jgi:hypothetical protein